MKRLRKPFLSVIPALNAVCAYRLDMLWSFVVKRGSKHFACGLPVCGSPDKVLLLVMWCSLITGCASV